MSNLDARPDEAAMKHTTWPLCPFCGNAPRHVPKAPGALTTEHLRCDPCGYGLPPHLWCKRADGAPAEVAPTPRAWLVEWDYLASTTRKGPDLTLTNEVWLIGGELFDHEALAREFKPDAQFRNLRVTALAPHGAPTLPAYRQVGWTIDTGSGRIFDTGASLGDEQRTRWQPVYVADGVATPWKPPLYPATPTERFRLQKFNEDMAQRNAGVRVDAPTPPEPPSFRTDWGGRVVAWGDALAYGRACYEAGKAGVTTTGGTDGR